MFVFYRRGVNALRKRDFLRVSAVSRLTKLAFSLAVIHGHENINVVTGRAELSVPVPRYCTAVRMPSYDRRAGWTLFAFLVASKPDFPDTKALPNRRQCLVRVVIAKRVLGRRKTTSPYVTFVPLTPIHSDPCKERIKHNNKHILSPIV